MCSGRRLLSKKGDLVDRRKENQKKRARSLLTKEGPLDEQVSKRIHSSENNHTCSNKCCLPLPALHQRVQHLGIRFCPRESVQVKKVEERSQEKRVIFGRPVDGDHYNIDLCPNPCAARAI
jgi:hypothetical protein